jgi:toluene monooxygenase system ferredoxin subunit
MSMEAPGAFVRLCSVGELREGAMNSFQLGTHEIIVLWPIDGEPKAYDGLCPHQQLPLADGNFDGRILVCAAHAWSFDAVSGAGIRPPGHCRLRAFPLRIEGADVLIEIADKTSDNALRIL